MEVVTTVAEVVTNPATGVELSRIAIPAGIALAVLITLFIVSRISKKKKK